MSLGQVELCTIVNGIAKERKVHDQFPKTQYQNLLFRKAETSTAIFLYPIKEFVEGALQDYEYPAEWVFYRSTRNAQSHGYGGSLLTFSILTEDEVIEDYELQGPWHSNAAALKEVAGVDIEATHCGWCVIIDNMGRTLYIDEAPVKGTFGRANEIAKKPAKERNEAVFLHRMSPGGSSTSWVSL